MKKLVEVETDFGNYLTYENDHFTEILTKYRSFVRNELHIIESLLKDGDLIIDVGAHIGLFSIPIIKLKNNLIRSICIEADKENYNVLLKNIVRNNVSDQIKTINAIVFDKKLRFRKNSTINNSGDTQFRPSTKGNYKTSIRIDDIYKQNKNLGNISVLKIDAEGAEYNILRSGEKLITELKPLIYCEINYAHLVTFNITPRKLDRYLSSRGYLYFRNIGKRHSEDVNPKIIKLKKIIHGGKFYDLIAIHKDDERVHQFEGAPIHKTKLNFKFKLRYFISNLVIFIKTRSIIKKRTNVY